jgi:hypothetical protein
MTQTTNILPEVDSKRQNLMKIAGVTGGQEGELYIEILELKLQIEKRRLELNRQFGIKMSSQDFQSVLYS